MRERESTYVLMIRRNLECQLRITCHSHYVRYKGLLTVSNVCFSIQYILTIYKDIVRYNAIVRRNEDLWFNEDIGVTDQVQFSHSKGMMILMKWRKLCIFRRLWYHKVEYHARTFYEWLGMLLLWHDEKTKNEIKFYSRDHCILRRREQSFYLYSLFADQ